MVVIVAVGNVKYQLFDIPWTALLRQYAAKYTWTILIYPLIVSQDNQQP